jgi:Flp pilus assembly protein TadD
MDGTIEWGESMDGSTQRSVDLARQQAMRGEVALAEATCRGVLKGEPNQGDALNILGMLALQSGRIDEAVEVLGRAVAANPLAVSFHSNLGMALSTKGRLDDAIAEFRRAIALKPDYAEAHSNLSLSLTRRGLHEEAIQACQEAIRLQPTWAELYVNYGSALRESGRLDDAMAAFRKAIALKPSLVNGHMNLGAALVAAGEHERGIESLRRAVQVQPKAPLAHWNLGMALLLVGNYEQGWAEYEWRFATRQWLGRPTRLRQGRWDGAELGGRSVLVYGEQGFGDAIQFARYVPMVAGRGGKVVLQVKRELVRLMKGLVGVERVIAEGEEDEAIEVQCPLLSLPGIFGTTVGTIPVGAPYLSAEENAAAGWRARLDNGDRRLKVGLAWTGKTLPGTRRSVGLDRLAAFWGVEGVRFVSLQKEAEAAGSRDGMDMVDWTAELKDFADTAALISCLDLVISIDTSVAHMAGAMGKATWVMLPFAADWRWLVGRGDSPWYPTMRLFRQKKADDWSGPVAEIAAALAERVRA